MNKKNVKLILGKGQNRITISWPKGTGRYNQYTFSYAGYRFDRLCDANTCQPSVCSNSPGAAPVQAGQTNVYNCDTSFLRDKFPCSTTGERPCMGDQVQNWQTGYLPSAATAEDPYAKRPLTISTNYDFPVILTVVDNYNQAEHFLIKNNGQFIGETGRETGYSNANTCGANNDCALNSKDYTRGFFLIPAGMFTHAQ